MARMFCGMVSRGLLDLDEGLVRSLTGSTENSPVIKRHYSTFGNPKEIDSQVGLTVWCGEGKEKNRIYELSSM